MKYQAFHEFLKICEDFRENHEWKHCRVGGHFITLEIIFQILNQTLFHLFTAQTVDVIAVEGKSISLQCPIAGTDVAMVLWFKNGGGIPLYRYNSISQALLSLSFNYTVQHFSISSFPVLLSANSFFGFIYEFLFVCLHFVVFLLMLIIKDL